MLPGFEIHFNDSQLGFRYGVDCFGPEPEFRRLDDIRGSLRRPDCDGPDPVYAIAMDVGKREHRQALIHRNLLVGAVAFSSGMLGEEPVRSQGHVHAVSTSCGSSTPELYEVWAGVCVVYMQERTETAPGRCFAVTGLPGDQILVPPGWAHMTINANAHEKMVFGAFCVRDYGFEYANVRALHGLCHFPIHSTEGMIRWEQNTTYEPTALIHKHPRPYTEFGLDPHQPLYTQYEQCPEIFDFIARPNQAASKWIGFVP